VNGTLLDDISLILEELEILQSEEGGGGGGGENVLLINDNDALRIASPPVGGVYGL
jgi:hypothetical protein